MSEKLEVEIIIPVYNEEEELETNVLKLRDFSKENLRDFLWHITIADNASMDKTGEIGQKLAQHFPEIAYFYLSQKGRGWAVKKAWEKSEADICVYIDVDLSTDLKHLLPLVNSLTSGYDLAIGSRLLPKSKVAGRTLKREIISRAYNLLIKILFQIKFSDAQCGFKAVTKRVVKELIPQIQDNEWFFDSELLIVGEKSGYKIYEEPVAWVDNPGSTVRVLGTAWGDLKGLWRLFWKRPWRKRGST